MDDTFIIDIWTFPCIKRNNAARLPVCMVFLFSLLYMQTEKIENGRKKERENARGRYKERFNAILVRFSALLLCRSIIFLSYAHQTRWKYSRMALRLFTFDRVSATIPIISPCNTKNYSLPFTVNMALHCIALRSSNSETELHRYHGITAVVTSNWYNTSHGWYRWKKCSMSIPCTKLKFSSSSTAKSVHFSISFSPSQCESRANGGNARHIVVNTTSEIYTIFHCTFWSPD